ncbi:hypothetical protein AURDEDRAFT_164685 [Auricularia subglabra TFB-10046 SS5]|nr:hypothetical protein AURDEDRAFT_164685 [Auricularia subglabra TFB-10046 SS5]
MVFTSSVGRLPVEILSMIAVHLDIQHLLTLSHVCVRWTAVARAHPVFWRDIRLAAVSHSALEFFQARLVSGLERGVYITLCLADHPSCDGIRTIVLPAITRNLFRVVQLGLDLQSDVADSALPALSKPAPHLESFSLRFFHCSKARPAVTLAPNLFASHCPRLTDLSLADVAFPKQPILAFHNAHSVMFHFHSPRAIPFSLFEHLPALQKLIVMGPSCLGVESADGKADLPPLRELQLWLTRYDYDAVFESITNLASVAHVLCRRPHDQIARRLVADLHGPLELHFLRIIDRMVHMHLYDSAAERGRTLVEQAAQLPDDLPRTVLFAPDLQDRIITLLLDARLAYLVPHLDELPRCRTLEIILVPGVPVPSIDISTPLRLPELCEVVCGNGEEHPTTFISVDADPLRKFLSQLLGAGPKRPSLRLHGIIVKGDRDALFSDYDNSTRTEV